MSAPLPSKHVSHDTMEFLRAHRGQKFTPLAIANAIGHDPGHVARILLCRFAAGNYRDVLQRERGFSNGSGNVHYWLNEQGPSETPEQRLIGRWMLRHRMAARPSQIAKGSGVALSVVRETLDAWCAVGSAVRCELVMRDGIDRFEYRLSYGTESHFGRSFNPSHRRAAA